MRSKTIAATMPCRVRALFIAVVLVAIALAVFPASAGFAPGDAARLEAGEAVVRVTQAKSPADGAVFAAIDIPAPPAAVWAVLTDCASAPSFLPNLQSCRVLEQAAGGLSDVREHKIAWSTLLPDLRSVFRSDYNVNSRIAFSRVEGDLKFLEGEWQLTPQSGGKATRLVYNTRVGFHALVPAFLIRNALAKDIPQFLSTIRAEVLRRGST